MGNHDFLAKGSICMMEALWYLKPFLSFCISKSCHYLTQALKKMPPKLKELFKSSRFKLVHARMQHSSASSVKLELCIQMSSQRQSAKDCGRKPLQSNYSFFRLLKHLQEMALALVFVLSLKSMDWKRDVIFMAYTNILMFPDYTPAGANFHVTICNS